MEPLLSAEEMPLQPLEDYLVLRVFSIPFFRSVEGTDKILAVPQIPGARRSRVLILQVVATGPGKLQPDGTLKAPPFQVGEYVLTHPNNCEISWDWPLTTDEPFQVVRPELICARIDREVVEVLLARAEQAGKQQEELQRLMRVSTEPVPPNPAVLGPDGEEFGRPPQQ